MGQMKKTLSVEVPKGLRLGQAVYNAVLKHLKDNKQPHGDTSIMNGLFAIPDATLLSIMKELK